MDSKWSLLMLGVLLLVQNSFEAPSTAATTNADTTNPFKPIIERFKLLSITLEELVELHNLIVEEGQTVFQKVLQDPKITEVKSKSMDDNLKKIRNFVAQLEKDPKETQARIFEFLDEFGEIVSKFEHERRPNITPEEEIVEKSLKENGFDEFKAKVFGHFSKFITKFSTEVDQYISGLTEKERKEETKLISWFEKLKSEKNVEEQFDMFDDFFKNTDPEDSSSDESSE